MSSIDGIDESACETEQRPFDFCLPIILKQRSLSGPRKASKSDHDSPPTIAVKLSSFVSPSSFEETFIIFLPLITRKPLERCGR
jgi:hypothetical protein